MAKLHLRLTCCYKTDLQCLGVRVLEVIPCGHTGPLADDLQRQAAEETGSLKPPHSYVPWVTVNGIPLGGTYDQTLQIFICAAYLGDRYDHV